MPDYTVKPDIDTLLRSDNNAAARTNLGVQAALTSTSPLGLSQGGTGAINASAALAALSGVPTTRTLSVGTGLTGGGDLSANRTISISSISTSQITGLGGAAVLSVGTTAGTVAAGNDSRFTDSRTPTGSAGGDLAGTYPNPTIATVAGLTSGQYGSASSVAQITINAKGQATLASNVAIAIGTNQMTGLSATALGAITQLSGDVTTGTGGGSQAATLKTLVGLTSGQYGSATSVAQVTINEKGLTTLASSVPIAITTAQVAGLNAAAVGALPLTGGTVTGSTVVQVTDTNAALRVTQLGTGNAIVVEDETSPDSTPFVVTATGAVIAGASTITPLASSIPRMQAHSTSITPFDAISWYAGGANATTGLAKSRSGNPGTYAIVQSGDAYDITFRFDNGASLVKAAGISAIVDGTPSSTSMPGKLVFSTSPVGTIQPVERLTISPAGKVGIGTAPDSTAALKVDTNGIMFGDGTTQTTAATGGGTATDVQVFTSSGTWTKPAGAIAVDVVVISAGGGGGSGRKAGVGSQASGGGGGGGGSYSIRNISASLLGATETVTVGSGGTGGAAVSVNSTNGNAGGTGGNSSFGTWVQVQGGGGAAVATTASGGAGASASARAMFQGANGGAGGGGTGTGGSNATTGAAGGGSGGGLPASATVGFAGGAGGTALGTWLSGGGGSAGAIATNGGAGSNVTATFPASSGGGGGGGSSVTGNAGSGGNGGTYGGGGGGGGGGLDSVGNSGAGGNGADGIVIVTTYF